MSGENSSLSKHRPIKTILVSQPKPERSPYFNLEKKYDLKIDWRPFIYVEGVGEKEFRKQKIRPDEYTAIIFTSKNAIDHFFRLVEEMRIKMPQDTKYFCFTAAVANYLQKFIVYRKRKVFVGVRNVADLAGHFEKHKEKEKFLLPAGDLGSQDVIKFLEDGNYNYQKAVIYRTVASDLSDLSEMAYDALVFFSPLGISSLYENFPDFEQNGTRIAVFGNKTKQAVLDKGLQINIMAPSPESPSMTMALENYIKSTL